MTTENGLSLADIAAVTKNNGCMDGYGGMNGLWNNPFIYLIWMWAMRSFNGWGDGNNAALQGALTRSDLYEGFNTNDILRKLDNAGDRLSDGFHDQTTSMLQGFNGVQRDLCQGFNAINNGIAENRFAAQQCCCETREAIADVRAENYRNTCEITNAIHNESEATRALINSNIMQGLRDKLEDKDRELLQANYLNSQLDQTARIIQALRPTPIPAYQVSSPYTSLGSGCGCGGTTNYAFG